MSNGTLSLALKHLWVYHQVLRHGLSQAIVMEDDSYFGDNTDVIGALNDVVANIDSMPTAYNLLELSGCKYAMHATTFQQTDHIY
eukprot:CAMPEP_0197880138 /NCGR_PEP_ID=MMETSP1439-20131203/8036_1 /TAXON_ID=66791 /ORGANISM="Gonyaulax spinifera, Strain CCMP409" /LENGTH=84 /DNA_ID=CAMNT_0043499681 /DNA_START=26 /DNA_END=277 /DNA_ORIENTATION=+